MILNEMLEILSFIHIPFNKLQGLETMYNRGWIIGEN